MWILSAGGIDEKNSSDSKEDEVHSHSPLPSLFDANELICTLLMYVTLILTFGVVFPPLAMTLVVAAASVVYYMKFNLGNFINCANELGRLSYVDRVNKDCASIGSSASLTSIMWMMVTTCCLFYTLFLFDTLGDAVGFEGAFWVLVVMPLMPLLMYVMVWGYERRYGAYVPPSKPCESGIAMTELHLSSKADALPLNNNSETDDKGSNVSDISCNPIFSQADPETV